MLARALAKDLDARQQSAVSFAAELRSVAAMFDVRAGETVRHVADAARRRRRRTGGSGGRSRRRWAWLAVAAWLWFR